MVVIELLYNLFALVALSVLSGFIDNICDRASLRGKVLQGLLFGLIALVGMRYPFVIEKGLIFDGRTIVISLCTFFFGPVSGLIAVVIAFAYRLWLGGPGVIMGVTTILTAFLIGYYFFVDSREKQREVTWKRLYLMGLIVHLVMIILMFSLPSVHIRETLRLVAVTVFLFYPLITVLIGKVLADQQERKKTLRLLSLQENTFRLLVQNSADIIAVIDKDAVIKYLSPAVTPLMGYDAEKLLGSSSLELVHPEYLPAVVERLEDLLLHPENISVSEILFRHADGHYCSMEVVGQNFLHQPGISGIILNLRDVTERKRNAEALLQKIEELERFQRLTVGREIRIIELKKEVNMLLKESGKPAKYPIAE
ncbi:MAG TPA: LytS/YhcK type 5TM receptor domain-containing protein [Bacteroidales bacterium]|nr:LytS/YhcK type 5TM receptor domain-containing protein [Bacteroidales bacterium]HSA43698.1 LytS/YhcK type 5TM receptor domain-containing protein [Bacteroidales bacterium]